MRDFSDLDREAARGKSEWLWHIGGRWTAGGDTCALARNGYGRLVPMSGVADGRVKAALDAGAWVVAAFDGNTAGNPVVAVRKAPTAAISQSILPAADIKSAA